MVYAVFMNKLLESFAEPVVAREIRLFFTHWQVRPASGQPDAAGQNPVIAGGR